jgi:hypothetical protein
MNHTLFLLGFCIIILVVGGLVLAMTLHRIQRLENRLAEKASTAMLDMRTDNLRELRREFQHLLSYLKVDIVKTPEQTVVRPYGTNQS